MLYDPKWVRPKAPQLKATFQSCISWLETKDPNERYGWILPSKCACGQFAKHLGFRAAMWGGDVNPKEFDFFTVLNGLAYHEPRTFGSLLTRVKAAAVA